MSKSKMSNLIVLQDTKDHLERFKEGTLAWNKWAYKKLREKEELEKAGKWKVKKGALYGSPITVTADENIPEIQKWLDEVYIDFSKFTFLLGKESVLEEEKKQERNFQGLFSGKMRADQKIKIDDTKFNFFDFVFPGDVSFEGVNFEGEGNFRQAKFYGIVNFDECVISGKAVFTGVTFMQRASFSKTIIKDETDFTNAVFLEDANFWDIEFYKNIRFIYTKFHGPTYFSTSEFKKRVSFAKSSFYNTVSFHSAEFKGHADFYEVNFLDNVSFVFSKFKHEVFFVRSKFKNDANFNCVDFKSSVFLGSASFHKSCDFEAILAKRAFNLKKAKFSTNIPNFTQANFAEAPRLDDIEVVPYRPLKFPGIRTRVIAQLMHEAKASSKRRRSLIRDHFLLEKVLHRWKSIKDRFFNDRNDKEEEAKFRALKRLAIQAHDHENEINFFAGEIRSRRHIKDFPNPFRKSFANSSKYWAGVLYELTSDFGRSFLRPVGLWILSFLLFTSLYYACSEPNAYQLCETSQISPGQRIVSPWTAAATITAKNSLLFIGTDRTDKLKRSYVCLYGASPLYDKSYYSQSLKTKSADQSAKNQKEEIMRLAPNVPSWVSFWGVINSIISLALTFLFLLAIRNQFKIK